jgi:hypothetical protein
VGNNFQKDQLTKTSILAFVKSPYIDISGQNNLFKVGKAGEDVTAAFRT